MVYVLLEAPLIIGKPLKATSSGNLGKPYQNGMTRFRLKALPGRLEPRGSPQIIPTHEGKES